MCVHKCVCACACVCVCVCACVCDDNGVRANYIKMCKCVLHMYMLCEYSVRNKSPKSLQVVQAQSV